MLGARGARPRRAQCESVGGGRAPPHEPTCCGLGECLLLGNIIIVIGIIIIIIIGITLIILIVIICVSLMYLLLLIIVIAIIIINVY